MYEGTRLDGDPDAVRAARRAVKLVEGLSEPVTECGRWMSVARVEARVGDLERARDAVRAAAERAVTGGIRRGWPVAVRVAALAAELGVEVSLPEDG